MGVQYLIDLFAPSLPAARILDVSDPPSLATLINGTFVVRIPPNVSVQNPANLGDLVTQKYAGLMAANAGFTRMVYDDLLDSSGVNLAVSKGIFGQRGTTSIFPGALLQSAVTPLTGATATQAFITWEVYQYLDQDNSSQRFQRSYLEVPTSPNTTCMVSFNGGGSFLPVNDGAVLNIPNVNQGTNFVIKLTNASGSRLSIGSWALIY